MASYKFKKITVKDEDLNRVQDAVSTVIDAILSIPFLDGRLVETMLDANKHEVPIVITSTPQNIPHKLGRAYRGWVTTSRNADIRIWEDPVVSGVNPNVDPTKFIRLVGAGTDATVKLWVF